MDGNLEAGLDGRTGEARTASTRRRRVGAWFGAVGPGQMDGNLEAGLDGRTGEARTASTRRRRVGA
jgi:hypothetical protein